MRLSPMNIIPITKARGKLGELTESVKDDSYIVLTKEGNPMAALVDVNYLSKLEEQVKKAYQKTFIDPKLLPYTRKFTNEEVVEWLKEDTL